MERTVRSIIEQHPQGVALLFSKYQVDADITARNLQNAIKFFGDPFVYDLHALTKNNQVSNFLGLFSSKEEREARRVKRLAEGKQPVALPQVIEKGLGIFKLLTGVSVKGTDEDQEPKSATRILGISKPIMIGLIALIVVLFLLRKN